MKKPRRRAGREETIVKIFQDSTGRIQRLQPAKCRAEIRNGVLILSAWQKDGFEYSVAVPLGAPVDDHLCADDLEGIVINPIDGWAIVGPD